MNRTLEKSLSKVKDLPEAEQAQLGQLIDEFIQQRQASVQFDRDMQDPEYRAYVEDALAEGEADIAAGRVYSAQEVFADLKAPFKAKHGL